MARPPRTPARKASASGTAAPTQPDNETVSLFEQGLALHQQGRIAQADLIYQRVLEKQPSHSDALHLLGVIALQRKYFTQAAELIDRAIVISPHNAAAYYNRGIALQELKRLEDALVSYDKAIAIKPDYAEAYSNRGNALKELKRLEDALVSYDKAIAIKPDYAEAYSNRGNALQELKRLEDALTSYEQAIRMKHDISGLPGIIAHVFGQICRWPGQEALVMRVTEGLLSARPVSSPFPTLALLDDPPIHRRAAEVWVKENVRTKAMLPPMTLRERGSKIHIAYLSADFHHHATSYLMAELFEFHSRERFEITAISFGPDDITKDMRLRLTVAFDRFEDVRQTSDRDVARRCRELGVDVAVDLKGFTQDSRPGILAERCAPIQINWLGYPGTMAAPFVDYIVADPTLITEEDLEHYTEKVIWLPDTYQVNDGKRQIADKQFTRSECGLPARGFVYCCFNNNYKILPATFDVWMRILKRVPDSVLWLFEDNPSASKNLRVEAASREVDPNRLVFAKRMPLAEHLARHRVADLFIDTWPCNAHTTASDALWAGLPLMTRAGQSFASRVAASLLKAIGLPDLITYNDQDYEDLAVALAKDPERLQSLKDRLATNRLTCPLFDCKRFTGHLELAYQQVMERYWEGKEPEHLTVVAATKSDRRIDESMRRAGDWAETTVDLGLTATDTIIPAERAHSGETVAWASANLVQQSAQAITPKLTQQLPPKQQAPIAFELQQDATMIESIISLGTRIEVMDVGAAFIAEVPVYRKLLDRGIAHLHAFEGDERQIQMIRETYRDHVSIYPVYLFDGSQQTAYLASEGSGMTSLLRPNARALRFFNGFEEFGRVSGTECIATHRLDDIEALKPLDFIKMDIQGAELTVLKHGLQAIKRCVAIQLEVSFIALYEAQPVFGEVDVWMRTNGFVPHCFLDVKRWSIAPTVRNGNFRIPFNQLLEADVVYVRDPLELGSWSDEQLRKLAVLAHECFSSPDLTIHLLAELDRRYSTDTSQPTLKAEYLKLLNTAKP